MPTSPGIARLVTAGGGPNPIPAPLLVWASGQMLTISGASAPSGVFNATFDTLVAICATTDVWYTIGAAAVAQIHVAGSHFMPTGQLRFEYVPAGQIIAAIQNTAGGFMSCVPASVGQ